MHTHNRYGLQDPLHQERRHLHLSELGYRLARFRNLHMSWSNYCNRVEYILLKRAERQLHPPRHLTYAYVLPYSYRTLYTPRNHSKKATASESNLYLSGLPGGLCYWLVT